MVIFIVLMSIVLVVTATIVTVSTISSRRRRDELQELAQHHDWQWSKREDMVLNTCPSGPPLSGDPRRSKAFNVIKGRHRDRYFAAFEYMYTTIHDGGHGTRSKTHRYAVWTIRLPAPLPRMAVGFHGASGDFLGQAFGLRRMNIGDDEFNRRFTVRCDDQRSGARLFHPEMVDLLMSTGAWAWRIDGNVMLSYTEGPLDAADVVLRLELMNRVLDNVPAEVWEQHGRSPA
ncbi:hypothetical protein [Phytoactinopolyspora endophytica]|uniref:hypothetical protein n=1 Tax=Phytoactinopolyspora endophytica TaxID=1642495 RepID=UPI00101DFFB4|nr:hypothetical protein [Phytoactinopolyspora endophytica]